MLIEMDSIIVANVRTSYVMQQHKSSDHTKRYICVSIMYGDVVVVVVFFCRFATNGKPLWHIRPLYMYRQLCTVHAYRMYQLKPITIHADMFAFYWNDALYTTGLLPDLA